MESSVPEVLLLQARTIEQTIDRLRAEACRLTRKAHRLQEAERERAEMARDLAAARRYLGESVQDAGAAA